MGGQDATEMVTEPSKSGRNERVRSWCDLGRKGPGDMWPVNDTGRADYDKVIKVIDKMSGENGNKR